MTVIPSEQMLVVMPNWIGDAVMATPTLRAIGELYPKARITALVRSSVKPIIDSCPWVHRIVTVRSRRKGMSDGKRTNPFVLARRLSSGRFDTAVLLPNSFRSALLTCLAGIPRRVGYDRDGRGFLLTDRLLPLRSQGKFVPVSTRDYYLGIASYLGAAHSDPAMRLFTRPDHDEQADRVLRKAGFDPGGQQRLVLINPGASYGEAKVWYPERFAAVADRCVREFGAAVAVTGAPRERRILDRVIAAAREKMIDLPRCGIDLTLLKSVVRRSSLMVTNDTGPRHMAAAMGVPVVTVFGPTDPAWTEIGFEAERHVMVKVFCGPCQKKTCPLDHRCMTQVTPDMVFERAAELLTSGKVIGSRT
jgi:heptosyltransferase-2